MAKQSVVRKVIEINSEDADWLEKTYPNHSYSWLIGMLLHEFRVQNSFSPQHYAALAVSTLGAQLDGNGKIREG